MAWYNLTVPGQKPMTTPAAAAGPTPAPKSLLARVIGVIVTPRETFQSIVPAPKVFGILAVTTVLSAFFLSLIHI